MTDQEELPTQKPTRGGDAGLPPQVIGLTILWHPDVARVGDRAVLFDAGQRGERKLSRREPEFRRPDGASTGPLSTSTVSRSPAVIRADGRGGVAAGEDQEAGLLVGLDAVSGPGALDADALALGAVLQLGDCVTLLLHSFAPGSDTADDLGILGDSAAIRRVREDIHNVADLSVPVLLRGESGVGKELVASAIHRLSPRREGPLVCVNMAAVPQSLAASMLFGHERGAFSGATTRHPGYFADAHGGTLFLDEIGDTPGEVQPMLLRAIEQGKVQTLGGPLRDVDVRLIAATDSNLEHAIRERTFRRPLFERLAGYEIRLPPLRERREDIGRLFARFASEELQRLGRTDLLGPDDRGKAWIPGDVVARLAQHAWPGNVRQLRNVTSQLMIRNRNRDRFVFDAEAEVLLDRDGVRAPAPAPDLMPEEASTRPSKRPSTRPRGKTQELTDDEIVSALERSEYVFDAAAETLGVSRSWFFKRVKTMPQVRQGKDLTEGDLRRSHLTHRGDHRAMAHDLGVSVSALKQQIARLGLEL